MSFEEVCEPRFAELLRASGVGGHAAGRMRDSAEPTVGLWPDLTIAYLNPAWFRFASDNDAPDELFVQWTLGRSVLDAMPPVLRAHYAAAYEQCLQTKEPWDEDYECSSPDRFRTFRATAYPLPEGAGLLVVHSLRLDRPHQRRATDPSRQRFVDRHGWLTQCAYCRRFAEAGGRGAWAWIPDWVREPPASPVTHGICGPCADHYFGVARRRSRLGG